MNLFRSIMLQAFDDREGIESAVNRFEKEHDGMVLEPLVIESDEKVTNPDKEILPEIIKSYPEAEILSWERIPEFVNT